MNQTLGNIFGQQPAAQPVQPVAQPVAQPVQPVAQPVAQPVQPVAQPAIQPVQPVTQPVQPVQPSPIIAPSSQPAPVTFAQPSPIANPAPAPVAQPNALGGGSRLASIRSALKTAKVSSNRADIPLGSGLYLLKSGQYTVTERTSTRLTNYSFICIKGIKDGLDVPYGGPGYTGAIPGEEYNTALFHDGDYALSSILKALSACFGWSPEMVKVMQSDERLDQTLGFIDMFTGVSAETCLPNNQPCCFSNQVILQMSSVTKVSEVKVNGKPTYEKGSDVPITKSYTNTFWDKRVPIQEAVAGLDDAFIIKAFGSVEAVQAALETEKQLDAFA